MLKIKSKFLILAKRLRHFSNKLLNILFPLEGGINPRKFMKFSSSSYQRTHSPINHPMHSYIFKFSIGFLSASHLNMDWQLEISEHFQKSSNMKEKIKAHKQEKNNQSIFNIFPIKNRFWRICLQWTRERMPWMKEEVGRSVHPGRLKVSEIKHPIGVNKIPKDVYKTTKRK